MNALLLAAFFAEAGGEAMKTKASGFFGYRDMSRLVRNLLRQLGFAHVDEETDGRAALRDHIVILSFTS